MISRSYDVLCPWNSLFLSFSSVSFSNLLNVLPSWLVLGMINPNRLDGPTAWAIKWMVYTVYSLYTPIFTMYPRLRVLVRHVRSLKMVKPVLDISWIFNYSFIHSFIHCHLLYKSNVSSFCHFIATTIVFFFTIFASEKRSHLTIIQRRGVQGTSAHSCTMQRHRVLSSQKAWQRSRDGPIHPMLQRPQRSGHVLRSWVSIIFYIWFPFWGG